MARAKDGRIGVSVNQVTIRTLDLVRQYMLEEMGINASYTQAIQYMAHEYFIRMQGTKDNVTDSHSVPTETEGE